MLFVLSGATAAGKSTVSRRIVDRVPGLVGLEEDRRHAHTAEERLANLEGWIEDALEIEARGRDAVFGTQSPLGEVLASPRAVGLEGIAPCLLDAHDFVRLDRWIGRGGDPERLPDMDHFCWAAFHRLHARDPRFGQHVFLERSHPASVWSRWMAWTADDPRWDVFIHDSSGANVETSTEAVATWIRSVRAHGAPLRRADAWWA